MNLLQIRKKFKQLSGRHDLVNEDYSDNGADFFINEGRKYLDRLTETQKSWATQFKFLNVGEYLVTFPYCRAIKEVWVNSSTARWQLEKKLLQDLITDYGTGVVSGLTNGTPLYYAPCISRTSPEDMSAAEKLTFASYIEIPAKMDGDTNAILVNVPTDAILAVEIKGLFYSMELTNDTDSNYWSEVHPLLLCMAAMRQVEVVYGVTQGVADITASISSEMSQLGMDLVDEIISEQSEIE
jgi:hypothetical protein